MARPPQISFIGPSMLGQRIRTYLDTHGITGDRLQELMHQAVPKYKASPARISKYTTQGRPIPSDQFLLAVARVLELPLDEVKKLAGQPSLPDSQKTPAIIAERQELQKFSVVIGHTIWSAPVVLAAMEGLLPQFKIATYLENSQEKGHQPVFIDAEAWSRSNCEPNTPQRRAVPNQPTPLCPRDSAIYQDKSLETLSAATAYRLIEQRDDVDAIIVPGRFAQERALRRLACIADTRVGCLWLAPPTAWEALAEYSSQFYPAGDPKAAEKRGMIPEISTEWLAGYLLNRVSPTKNKRFIALDSDTIAMSVLQAGFEAVNPGRGRSATGYYSKFETEKLVSASYSEIQDSSPPWIKREHSEFVGLITWSPQAHWVAAKSRSASLKVCGLMSPLDVRDRHLTFELCVNPRTANGLRGKQLLFAIGELVQTIAPICDGLNLQSTVGADSANIVLPVRESHLAKLSNYFAITCDDVEIPEEYATPEQLTEIRKALAPINFDAAWRGAEIQELLPLKG